MNEPNVIADHLIQLFRAHFGEGNVQINVLPGAGSDRKYFRLIFENGISAIGTYNAVPAENDAFVYLSEHFISSGQPVPKVYGYDRQNHVYIQEDIGDVALFDQINLSDRVSLLDNFKSVIQALPNLQIAGDQGLDYSRCYPSPKFDKQGIADDLAYFAVKFVRIITPAFDTALFHSEFDLLSDHLSQAPYYYFMHRDFQSRNIFYHNNRYYFIDFQGGRKGPLQYDLISLIYQAKADLSPTERQLLKECYISALQNHISMNTNTFNRYFDGWLLLRLLQVLGAYGNRGLIEKKPHFVSSIPLAIANVEYFIKNHDTGLPLKNLYGYLENLKSHFDDYQNSVHRQ